MSRFGIASRRAAEELIAQGKVSVNGRVVREQGLLVHSRRDRIVVNGKVIEAPTRATWIAVHKPPGYLSLPKDGYGRTVTNIIPKSRRPGLLTVSGIEEDFSGLVLLTNERGHVADLSKPDNPHVKEWVVDVEGVCSHEAVEPLRRGVKLNGEITKSLPAVG